MAEYIDREKLMERMKYYFEHTAGDAHYTYGVAMQEIENAPAEDVVPVVHGEWNETKYPFCNVCPHCRMVIDRTCIKLNSGKLNLCPNCGAKMDGDVIKSMKRAGDSAKNVTESLRNVIDAFENADRCVCCGKIVPEGRQVCPGCETGGDSDG